MPINRKNFESGNFKSGYNRRDQHPVLLFLKRNQSKAYTITELASLIKMKKDAIRNMLGVLGKKGIVEHRTPYFILKIKNQSTRSKPVKKTKTQTRKHRTERRLKK